MKLQRPYGRLHTSIPNLQTSDRISQKVDTTVSQHDATVALEALQTSDMTALDRSAQGSRPEPIGYSSTSDKSASMILPRPEGTGWLPEGADVGLPTQELSSRNHVHSPSKGLGKGMSQNSSRGLVAKICRFYPGYPMLYTFRTQILRLPLIVL